jgi:cytochrome c5
LKRQKLVKLLGGFICATSLTTVIVAQQEPPPLTPEQQEKGRVLTERVCTACHAMDAQTAGGRTPDAWKRVVDEMIAMGASATDEEAKIIVDYLSHTYPAKN